MVLYGAAVLTLNLLNAYIQETIVVSDMGLLKLVNLTDICFSRIF